MHPSAGIPAGKVAGIVAEYNPFHNGHLLHLEKTRELTGAQACVAVMSGDFVQRGEPAVFDKWKRAEAAVRSGVDLVIELPFLYACNSAEFFAKGAIRLLSSMGLVTHLSFGSEAGELAPLMETASILAEEPDSFREGLRAALKSGLSYPAARSAAIEGIAGRRASRLLSGPNNILAVEYIKQIIRLGAHMAPVTFGRIGAGYFGVGTTPGSGAAAKAGGPGSDGTAGAVGPGATAPGSSAGTAGAVGPGATAPGGRAGIGIAGAGALRGIMREGGVQAAAGYVPDECRRIYEAAREGPMDMDSLFKMIAYAARIRSAGELSTILSASEGLENRLKKALDNSNGIEGLISQAKSKRYTETRIKRFLIHVLFGVAAGEFEALDTEGPGYLRVLAMNSVGRGLLRDIAKRAGAASGAATEAMAGAASGATTEAVAGAAAATKARAETEAGASTSAATTKAGAAPAAPAIITNLSRQFPASPISARFLEFDILSADIYSLAAGTGFRDGSDYRAKPFILPPA
ncbi:MAG: nucleotidyltransferase family protein [Clostridiales Family XIII bacterium]|jgi:predicted nucleotidyltransferase|nr:nucleotidyltransferase family protein [Clostridiales Family XIII bacterium]